MKRTTRNNILRYLISMVFVSVLLLIVSLLCLGFSWLDDKTGWPIYTVATVAGLIYMVWYIAQCITIKDEKDMQEALRTEYEKGRADVIEDTLSWLENCWPRYCSNQTIIEGFKEAIKYD